MSIRIEWTWDHFTIDAGDIALTLSWHRCFWFARPSYTLAYTYGTAECSVFAVEWRR